MAQPTTLSPAVQGMIEDCTRDCLTCHIVCLDTAMQALQKEKHDTHHIRTMLDCSEICQTAAHYMLRNSPFYGSICEVCAQICTHCGEMCEKAGLTDPANACRACAVSCQNLVHLVP
ncbi:MAG: four-helix bundle copper-binding protein [Ktedonobacteraceae bacterium]|nr:four-helix bundle copper-binding protein [Ktedonobacteraceae bacterium]